MESRFSPGRPVVTRGIHIDDSGATGGPVVADLKPAIVVEHSSSEVRFFTPAGPRTMVSRPIPAGRPKPWGPGEWELVEASWDRWNAVFHHAAGEWRSTWLLWTPEWEFLGWYVNLQEPIWQTRWGFDSRDLQLDIVVAPDGGWRWKDEHDLVRSRETGLISRENESKVRASGAEAIRLIERGLPPFDAGAKEWRPPPGWANLTLPDVSAEIELRTWSPEDALGRFE